MLETTVFFSPVRDADASDTSMVHTYVYIVTTTANPCCFTLYSRRHQRTCYGRSMRTAVWYFGDRGLEICVVCRVPWDERRPPRAQCQLLRIKERAKNLRTDKGSELAARQRALLGLGQWREPGSSTESNTGRGIHTHIRVKKRTSETGDTHSYYTSTPGSYSCSALSLFR